MPRGKKQIYVNGSVVGEKTYYYRERPDVYGRSKIWIEPIRDGQTVNFGGSEISLPVVDVNKYYSGAMAYLFIEEFEEVPAKMVDILYAYEDIIPRLQSDDRYLREFLAHFVRRNINIDTMKAPGLVVTPTYASDKRRFVEAVSLAIKDAIVSGKFKMVSHYMEEEKEVIDESYDYKNAKQDGIVTEFVKDFYEIISGTKIRRPTEPRKKKVVTPLSRQAIIMNCGTTIIGNEAVEKNFIAYHTSVQSFSDSTTMYIAGMHKDKLFGDDESSEENLEAFGNTIFESNILETFIYLNSDKRPINLFAGRYNEKTGKLEVDRQLERSFDNFNKRLDPNKTKPSEGR